MAKSKITRREFVADVATAAVMASMPNLAVASQGAARPFIKWAGGKGQLLDQLDALMPRDFAERENLTYVEPFVGGGAMLFHVLAKYPNIQTAVINDLNKELVTAFKVIKSKPDKLLSRLEELQREYRERETTDARKEMFLSIREKYNTRKGGDVEIAALLVFLNKTCFNGLYRVNSKGGFNVPFANAKNPLICDVENLHAVSKALQKVTILNVDFADVLDCVVGKAFFYFDPPYRPLTASAAFTAYSKGGFDDNEQRRLAHLCRKLDREGHQWLLSNSDPHNINPDDMFFEELYDGFDIKRVHASRMINSKADGRGKITELAIRNYKG